ncbi:MAG: hypothetical protein IKJ22_03760 [Paludibacteraceae bacterium]|nr:hypothetical protein [Paludibacteraceae bacterium]
MSKRLSKISRELNIGISTIAEFLNRNGYKCEEDPAENVSEEIVEFIKNNIESYLIETSSKLDELNPKKEAKKFLSTLDNLPLEIKLIEAASKKKKLVERIVGFTNFDWHYTVVRFQGICSQPIKFTLFDEVICKLLEIEQMSLSKIGKVLGFDIECDPAEKRILLNAINDLRKDQMIEGDESVYCLTDLGKRYVANGVKFSTYTRSFELYIDAIADVRENAKSIFSSLVSEKQSTFIKEKLPNNIEDVKPIAELQAPEIHYPSRNYILQSCKPAGCPEGFIGKVWVVLLENFKTNDYRVLVYDEKSGKIIEELSTALSKLEDQKKNILEKLISETTSDESPILPTDEQKNTVQLVVEQELIEKQDEIDKAIAENNYNKAEEIKRELLVSKRRFNSIEFEIELKHLFDNTKDEMWIISPWIKSATFKRLPFFEEYLKKGGRIFIAFSYPENKDNWNEYKGYVVSRTISKDKEEIMADKRALDKLLELEKKYHNFYILQLPAFHYKRVWLRQEDLKLNYTGSYNILSFFVELGKLNYRQEEMSKLEWLNEDEEEYKKLLLIFAEKYFNVAKEDINKLCSQDKIIDKSFLKTLNMYNFSKLKPFIGQGIQLLDDKYEDIMLTKQENIKNSRIYYYKTEISKLLDDAKNIGNMSVSFEQKKSIQSRLNILDNEFPEMKTNQNRAELLEIISKIKTIGPKPIKSYKKIYKK